MADQRTGQLNQIRHEGSDRAVVFLHGFTGSRDDTWERFPGLLGTQLQGWDIFTLGYATTLLPDVVGVWSADPDLPILATMFKTELGIKPLKSYASLVLIAHSMGGLVVLTFPPKTRPLAWKFICAEMGPTGGGHDTETAHGGTDHCGTQGRPGGHWGPRALPQTRDLGCHLL